MAKIVDTVNQLGEKKLKIKHVIILLTLIFVAQMMAGDRYKTLGKSGSERYPYIYFYDRISGRVYYVIESSCYRINLRGDKN